jgi:hypothetical protein
VSGIRLLLQVGALGATLAIAPNDQRSKRALAWFTGVTKLPADRRFVGLWLLQLRVLGLGLFQDWDVGVGVFPE